MPTYPQRSRSRARHLTGAITALAAVALAAALTAAPSAGAAPRPGSATRSAERTAVQAAAATTTLPADLSTGMPRTAHNETVGDFLHKGYDQRAVVENGRLNIYNPRARVARGSRSRPISSRWDRPTVTGGGPPAGVAGRGHGRSRRQEQAPERLPGLDTGRAVHGRVSDHVGDGRRFRRQRVLPQLALRVAARRQLRLASPARSPSRQLDTHIYAQQRAVHRADHGRDRAGTAGQVDGKAFVAIGYSDTEDRTSGWCGGDRPEQPFGGTTRRLNTR